MLRSLYTAGTGMVAQQQNLDVISNNLANVNTTGFRGQRAEFQDLMYQTMRVASKGGTPNSGNPEGIQFGLGTKISATASMFTQGNPQRTDAPLNLAITGEGFFKVMKPDGSALYTRDGTFKLDGDTGLVTTSQGMPLDPELKIAPGSTSITVKPNGEVLAIAPGKSDPDVVGTVQITQFANPGGLDRMGGNMFAETSASGTPVIGPPQVNGAGELMGGYIETSNVQVVDEMTRMITAQRAYEINSKAIQTADDMLGIVTNLKR